MNTRRLTCLVFFAVLGLLWSWFPARAGDETGVLSETEYWQLVTESQSTLKQLKASSGGNLDELEKLAARWETVNQVRLEDGSLMSVDSSGWVALMRAEPADLNLLQDLFDALEAERNVFEPASMPGESLEILKEILARPEYQSQNRMPDWLQKLIDRFWNWLFDLFGDEQEKTIVVGGPAFDFISFAAFFLIAGILAYTLNSLFSDFVSESSLEAEAAHEEPLSARMALSRAETLSKQGDYRSAVRFLYISALLILDERGLLFYDRTKTNREYLRNVADNARIAGLLRDVITVFDRVWYGFQPMDEETYQRYAAQVRELENLQ
ncbi:MAG: hypothetical protein CVU44_17115 [Chloroflexi bacterium HGW-Chloroflexi-6]|nr:MAG: hypothetical protein CVU44_17115 [Chloroflexi bacterium HGW-Chloroflexi-6]